MSLLKKAALAIAGLFVLLFILFLIFPSDYYKIGMDYLQKNDLRKAYTYLGKVKMDDPNFNLATSKLNELKPIVDSLNRVDAKTAKSNPDLNAEGKADEAATADAASSESKPTSIPGLVAVDVHGNLTSKGFDLDKEIGTEGCFYHCTKKEESGVYYVRIYGRTPEAIEEVKASFTNYTNENTVELSKDFLGYISTLSYDNADPEKAKEWVIKNIGKNAKTEIGGVKFEIIANAPKMRTLRVFTTE